MKAMSVSLEKGIIAPGSDADMILIDPEQENVLTLKDSSIDVD